MLFFNILFCCFLAKCCAVYPIFFDQTQESSSELINCDQTHFNLQMISINFLVLIEYAFCDVYRSFMEVHDFITDYFDESYDQKIEATSYFDYVIRNWFGYKLNGEELVKTCSYHSIVVVVAFLLLSMGFCLMIIRIVENLGRKQDLENKSEGKGRRCSSCRFCNEDE